MPTLYIGTLIDGRVTLLNLTQYSGVLYDKVRCLLRTLATSLLLSEVEITANKRASYPFLMLIDGTVGQTETDGFFPCNASGQVASTYE